MWYTVYSIFYNFLFSSTCQTWWWPYSKGPKHVVCPVTHYIVIKCCVLTHPPYISRYLTRKLYLVGLYYANTSISRCTAHRMWKKKAVALTVETSWIRRWGGGFIDWFLFYLTTLFQMPKLCIVWPCLHTCLATCSYTQINVAGLRNCCSRLFLQCLYSNFQLCRIFFYIVQKIKQMGRTVSQFFLIFNP